MKRTALLCLLIMTMLFAGCSKLGEYDGKGKGIAANNYPVTIYDVTVAKSPEKVISISPAITEIICELGFSDSLAGRSEYCTYPDSIKDIKTVGSSAKPDIDAIIAIAPDVLFTQSPMSSMDKTSLEAKKIKVVTIPAPKSYPELIDVYGAVAKVYRGNNLSDAAIADHVMSFNNELTAVSEKNHSKKYVWFMSEVGAIATGDTIESNLLSIFGTNVAADYKNYKADVAKIVEGEPDTVFVSKGMTKEMLPQEIQKYIDDKGISIIEIDNKLFEKPTLRVKEEIKRIDSLLDGNKEQTDSNTDSEEDKTESEAK